MMTCVISTDLEELKRTQRMLDSLHSQDMMLAKNMGRKQYTDKDKLTGA